MATSDPYADPNAPQTRAGDSPEGGSQQFTPPEGMTQDQFDAWFRNVQYMYPEGVTPPSPDKAWTDYQNGQFALPVSGRSLDGAVGSSSIFTDPVTSPFTGGIPGLIAGMVGGKQQYPDDPKAVAAAQAANQQQPQTGVLPGYSTEDLNAYTQNYLIPAMQANNQIMTQDMKDWGNFLKTMPGATSPIAQILQQQYKQEAPLYDRLAFNNWSQVLTAPYVGAMNQALGSTTAAGAHALTQYGQIATILANAGFTPQQIGGLFAGMSSTQSQGGLGASLTPQLTPQGAAPAAAAGSQYVPNVGPSPMQP